MTAVGLFGPEVVLNGKILTPLAMAATSITVKNTDGTAATLYTDATGATSTGTNVATTDSRGQLSFYAVPGYYDLAFTDSVGSQTLRVNVPDPLAVVVNVKMCGAKGDGATDDTAAIQSAINAAYAAGGGVVFFPPGTYIVDIASTVGGVTYGIYQSSNVFLSGPAATLKLKDNTSRNPSSNVITLIYALNETNIGLEGTLDGNRLNQGPWAYGPLSWAAGANSYLVRATYYLNCSKLTVPSLRIKNFSGQGFFVEGSSSNVKLGQIDSSDTLAAVCIDSVTNLSIDGVNAINSDPAPTINTTATTAISAGSTTTVTPASMAGIALNSVLSIGLGTTPYEVVLVTAVTGTTFTAYFANAHSGTYTIKSGQFASDSALQFGTACENCSFGTVTVDYSAASAVFGSAVEIFGAKDIAGAAVTSRGTWRSLWIHNWTISATLYAVENVAVASVVATNPATSATGIAPIGVFVDDNGYTSANPAKNISLGAVAVRYGSGGAAIPTNSVGLSANAQIQGLTVGATSIIGPTNGIVLQGTQGAVIGPFVVASTVSDGVILNSGASYNTLTGRVTAPGGNGVTLTPPTSPTKNIGNVFHVTVDGTGAAYWPIKLSGGSNPSTNVDNMFFGDVSQNSNVGILAPVSYGATISYNYAKMAGFNPVGHAMGVGGQPSVPASGTALGNDSLTDCTVIISGGTVSAIAVGGTATGLTSGSFRVPAGQTITLTYTVAPTWQWFGD